LPPDDPQTLSYAELLIESYRRLTGRELVVGVVDAPGLYEAPFPIVSHATQPDPIFCYANLAAQKLFGYSWDEFLNIPSRLSAEPDERQAREALLERARGDGYVDDYAGIRISKSGRRFYISDTTLWQVLDDHGILRGQAAVIRKWEMLD
jgi:PAS domain S-box-containing protein